MSFKRVYKRKPHFHRSRDDKESIPTLCERCGNHILISSRANEKCSMAAHHGSTKCKQLTSLRTSCILSSFETETNDQVDSVSKDDTMHEVIDLNQHAEENDIEETETNVKNIVNESIINDVYCHQQAIHRSLNELNTFIKIKKSSNADGKTSTEDTLELFHLKLDLGLSHKEMDTILDCFNRINRRHNVTKEVPLPNKSELKLYRNNVLATL